MNDRPHPLLHPFGKDTLAVIGETPLVAETPEELLCDETTPLHRFFIRNNGLLPEPATDSESWSFTIDGEVRETLRLTLAELKASFPVKTFRMVLECGGNGRSFFSPRPEGNAWTHGGAGCAEWTGVSLADVLARAGLTDRAVYTAHYGADPDRNGDREKPSISRGMRLEKALDPHTLLVFGMNGEPLPFIHGGPLRLIVPGWPGSLSQKWLTRIWIRDREHDGPGMTGLSYRLPVRPLAPGEEGRDVPTRIIESMPVRSIIASPVDGASLAAGTRSVEVSGAAWAGDDGIAALAVTLDGGATWTDATLALPRNAYDWTRWRVALDVPADGYYEIYARATDTKGCTQPFAATRWNANGYGCNVMHRVTMRVG